MNRLKMKLVIHFMIISLAVTTAEGTARMASGETTLSGVPTSFVDSGEVVPVHGVSIAELDKSGSLPRSITVPAVDGDLYLEKYPWDNLHINSLIGLKEFLSNIYFRTSLFCFNNNELTSLEGLSDSRRFRTLDFSNNKITTAGLGDGNIIFPSSLKGLVLKNNLIEDVPQSVIDQWKALGIVLRDNPAVVVGIKIDLRGNPLAEDAKTRLKEAFGEWVLLDETPAPSKFEKFKQLFSRTSNRD
jgi:Leucine-rich repeat (LRR) protein